MVVYNSKYTQSRVQDIIINKIKTPLAKVMGRTLSKIGFLDMLVIVIQLVLIFNRIRKLPEPTRENTNKHNTKVLLDMEELFFKYYRNVSREKVFRVLWKWGIIIYDWGNEYSCFGDWLFEQMERRGWERRPYQHPSPDYWREPEPYGGGYPLTDELEGSHIGYRILFDVREVEKIGKD